MQNTQEMQAHSAPTRQIEANVKNYDIRRSDTGEHGDLIGLDARATHKFNRRQGIATLWLHARQRSQGKVGSGFTITGR